LPETGKPLSQWTARRLELPQPFGLDLAGRSSLSDDARSMSGLMSGSTLYDTVLLVSIVAAIVAGVWLLWRI
jgi:hypothetical protein